MNKLIYDALNTKDTTNLSAFNTSIDIINSETGDVIFKGLKNKVILPGSGLIARKLFDVSGEEVTPTYNDKFGVSMYTPSGEQEPSEKDTAAKKGNSKILLFCCGIDGCGNENSQVYPVDYKKWIKPEDMIPFRYIPSKSDISDDLRKIYFGRTEISGVENFIAYYFKKFEGKPKFVQQYIDGTTIDSGIYESEKKEPAESYIEITLKITKEDLREYFNRSVGHDQARINSISLCSAYPVQEGKYVYYKDIRPLTKLHIPNEQLIDTAKGIEIIYHIYM